MSNFNVNENTIRQIMVNSLETGSFELLGKVKFLCDQLGVDYSPAYRWAVSFIRALSVSSTSSMNTNSDLIAKTTVALTAKMYSIMLETMGVRAKLPDDTAHHYLIQNYNTCVQLIKNAFSVEAGITTIGNHRANSFGSLLVSGNIAMDNTIDSGSGQVGVKIQMPTPANTHVQATSFTAPQDDFGALIGLNIEIPEDLKETTPAVAVAAEPEVVAKAANPIKVSLDFGDTMETYDVHELTPAVERLTVQPEETNVKIREFLSQPDWAARASSLVDNPSNIINYDEWGILIKSDIRRNSYYIDIPDNTMSELKLIWDQASIKLDEMKDCFNVETLREVTSDIVARHQQLFHALSKLIDDGKVGSKNSALDMLRLINALSYLFDMNLNNAIVSFTENGANSPLGGPLKLDGGLEDYVGFSRDIYDMCINEQGEQTRTQYFCDFYRFVLAALRKYSLEFGSKVITVSQGAIKISMTTDYRGYQNKTFVNSDSFGLADEVIIQLFELFNKEVPLLNIVLNLPTASLPLFSAGAGGPVKFYG